MAFLSAANVVWTDMSMFHILPLLIGGCLVYQIILAAWNLSPFHPLSHIPGPRLAAATYLPEFYHDAIRYGRYTRKIQQMHEKYGTCTRQSSAKHCKEVA